MTTTEFVKRIKDSISKSGYIHIDKNIPLESHGNILEWTGQALIGLANIGEKETIDLIIDGLLKNEPVEGLIPRTKCDTSTANPEPNKKKRWEKKDKTWWRSLDVSDSQLTFLILGLAYTQCNHKGKRLLKRILNRLINNDWIIKGIYGDNCRLGRFFSYIPIDNSYLRIKCILKIFEMINSDCVLSFFKNLLVKFNYIIFKILPLNIHNEDDRNTALLLWFIDNNNKKALKFFNKYKYTIRPTNNNIESDINFILMDAILNDKK